MSVVEAELVEPDVGEVWQRLSPVSVVFFIIKFAIRFVKQGLLNMLPAVAAFTVFANNKLFWISVMVPGLVVVLVVFSFLYFWFFKFQAREGEIVIQRGVFNKERLNLHFGRVQNVNIGVPFYFKPFKLVNCIIESAGSKSTEVDLPGVSKEFAQDLRTQVFAADRVKDEAAADASDSDHEGGKVADAASVLKLSNWESVKYGLTSYFAFVVLAGIAPFSGHLLEYIGENLFPKVLAVVAPVVGNEAVAGVMIVGFSVLLLVVLITSGSMLGALLRFYNYELHDDGDKLVRVAGLLERRSTTLTKQKVQSVLVSQNLVARLLNRITLQYRQVGGPQNKMKDTGIRIPLLMPHEEDRFSSMVFEGCPKPKFSGIHSSYVRRVFFYFWLLPTVCGLAIPVLLVSKFFLLFFMGLAPVYVLLKLRSRRFGFWFNEEYGAIRQGLFGQSYVVFPLYKVQVLGVRQSRGQRRRNVGNLRVQLGSGSLSIPYLPIGDLHRFVNRALYRAESSKQGWM